MKGADDERTKMQQWKRNLQKYKIAGASAGLKYLFFGELTIQQTAKLKGKLTQK